MTNSMGAIENSQRPVLRKDICQWPLKEQVNRGSRGQFRVFEADGGARKLRKEARASAAFYTSSSLADRLQLSYLSEWLGRVLASDIVNAVVCRPAWSHPLNAALSS